MIEEWAKSANITAESFELMGEYAVAAFAAGIKNGVPLREVLNSLGPALDRLIDKADELGLTGSEALRQLLEFRRVQKQFEAILTPLGLQRQLLEALTAAGVRSQAVFSGFSGSVLEAYKAMTKGGGDSLMAMVQLQPELQILWQLCKEGKLAIDDETRALLEQAEKAGLVGDKQRSINEQMLAAFGALKESIDAMTEAIWC